MVRQKGFAHAFLIIGLVLALIGALGFIFWQNSTDKVPASTVTDTSKNKSATGDENPDIHYLVIKQWGVQFPYTESDQLNVLDYKQPEDQNGVSSIIISDASLEKKYGEDDVRSVLGAGTIVRGKPSDRPPLPLDDGATFEGLYEGEYSFQGAVVKFGDYIYYFQRPQQCLGDCTDQRTIADDIEMNLKKLESDRSQ